MTRVRRGHSRVLSVIIVNWNTGPLLRRCVESVFQSVRRHSFEVIVVDNASVDGSAHDLSPRDGLVVTFNDRNVGFAAANNIALNVATGDYYLLLNPDTVVCGNAIDDLLDVMEGDARLGAVGPRLLSSDRAVTPSCSRFPILRNIATECLGLSRLLPKSSLFARTIMTFWDHASDADVDVICGACLLLRREAVEDVGVLDEQFFVYFEETDLCWRLGRQGWRKRFVSSTAVVHYAGESSRKNLDVRIVARYRSLMLFYDKHFGRGPRVAVRGLICFEMLWRSLAAVVMGNPSLTGVRRSELLRRYLRVTVLCVTPNLQPRSGEAQNAAA